MQMVRSFQQFLNHTLMDRVSEIEKKYAPLVNKLDEKINKAKEHLNNLLIERSRLFQEIINEGMKRVE